MRILHQISFLWLNVVVWTHCSSSHRLHPHSPLSGYTCWSWRCSFHLCTGTDRVSTVYLTQQNNVFRWSVIYTQIHVCCHYKHVQLTHCYRRVRQNCLRSHLAHCTRSCAPHSGYLHTACSLSYTLGWLRTTAWTQITNVNKKNMSESVLTVKRGPLTTVGLFLIRFVLAVCHAITSQSVVNTVSISTLKLIYVVTCGVEGWVTNKEEKGTFHRWPNRAAKKEHLFIMLNIIDNKVTEILKGFEHLESCCVEFT